MRISFYHLQELDFDNAIIDLYARLQRDSFVIFSEMLRLKFDRRLNWIRNISRDGAMWTWIRQEI